MAHTGRRTSNEQRSLIPSRNKFFRERSFVLLLLALIVKLSKTDHERFVEAGRLLIQCQLGGQVKMRVLTL